MKQIKDIIQQLDLQPHPEGGYYRETYRSDESVDLANPYDGSRNFSTCIYFLLTSDMFSAMHRIRQDEIWHFYLGSPIELHTLSAHGDHQRYMIGTDLPHQWPQLIVQKDHWFAARVSHKHSYALVGCTVSPGFDFADFELAKREELISSFPQHKELILTFTR